MSRVCGGGHLEMPVGYVQRQKSYNWRHEDGSCDSPEDAKWVGEVLPRLAPADEIKSVLDVGCRGGVSLAALEEALPNAYIKGVDVVPEFVEIAIGRGLDAQVADAHSLPFADCEFDWVVCRGTFEHFYDIHTALEEINRVARVGAYITCDLRNVPLGSDYAYSDSPEAWRKVMESGGRLKVREMKVHDMWVEFILCA